MLHDGRRHWRTAVVPSLRKHARWRLRRDDGVGRALTELLQPLLHRRGLGVCAARLRLLRDAWQRVHPQERGRVPVPRLRRSRAQWRVPRGRALLEAARRAWQVLRARRPPPAAAQPTPAAAAAATTAATALLRLPQQPRGNVLIR